MLQIADEIVFDRQVALVDVHDERKIVHVLNRGPGRRERDASVVPVGNPADVFERLARGNVRADVVKFPDRNPVHGRRGIHGLQRQNANVRAHHADHDFRIHFLEVRGKLRIVRKRWRARVQHGQFVVLRQRSHLIHRKPIRAAHRSAGCPEPSPPAAPATWDTRTT